jgi:hypothetical protein
MYLSAKGITQSNQKENENMTTYTLIEKQNSNSQREGVEFEANNLTQAKRKATKLQCFEGTFLELREGLSTVATKEANGKWIEQPCFA